MTKNARNIREIVESIQMVTGQTQEEVAVAVGYTRTYLSEAMKKGGNPKIISALLRHEQELSVKNTLTQKEGSRTEKTEPVKDVTPKAGKDGIKNEELSNQGGTNTAPILNSRDEQINQLIYNNTMLAQALLNHSEAAKMREETSRIQANATDKVAASNSDLAKYLNSPNHDELRSIVEEMSVISRSTRALVLELAGGRQFVSKAAATAYMGSLDSEMMNEKRGIRKNANSSGN